ncbi:MAG TPA: DUF3151 domain-containing protein [Egibacteraceae bacterium]|nr:DUF3151 domain-containing protein [Egibacteraceae bacterium]
MSENSLPLAGRGDTALPGTGDSGPETTLPAPPGEAAGALRMALAEPGDDRSAIGGRLRQIVAAHPEFLDGWAHLAAWALDVGDAVAAYAFARTGYHRGLDAIRKAGWRGTGSVPWRHETNHGFLRSLHALMRAAAAIGEMDEAQRCRQFLLDLDPDDHLGVGSVDVERLRG